MEQLFESQRSLVWQCYVKHGWHLKVPLADSSGITEAGIVRDKSA